MNGFKPSQLSNIEKFQFQTNFYFSTASFVARERKVSMLRLAAQAGGSGWLKKLSYDTMALRAVLGLGD